MASISSLALAGAALTSAAPASAAPSEPTLTLAQWNASQGTIDLHAAMAKNDAYLKTLTAMNLTMKVQESGSAGSGTETDTVVANKTSAINHYTYLDEESGESTAFDYYFKNGTYLESIASFQTGPTAVRHLKEVLTRLGKPKATAVNDNTATKLQGLADISPKAIWANAIRDPFATLASGNAVTYSEVVAEPDTIDATSTVYSWNGTYVENIGTPVTVTLAASETFNAAGLATAFHLEQHAGVYYNLVIDQTYAAATNPVMVFPAAKDMVNAGAMIVMGRRIEAEKLLARPATSIVAKATKLAKSGGAKLSASQLKSAATKLGITYKTTTGGIKISALSVNVRGSLCITAASGKSKIAPCN